MKHPPPISNPIDHQEFTFFRVVPADEDLDENTALIEIVRSWQNKNAPLLLEKLSETKKEQQDSMINTDIPF